MVSAFDKQNIISKCSGLYAVTAFNGVMNLCVSSCQYVVLEALVVAGTAIEVVLNTLSGVYISVCLWTDFVPATASETCKMESLNFTGV